MLYVKSYVEITSLYEERKISLEKFGTQKDSLNGKTVDHQKHPLPPQANENPVNTTDVSSQIN